MPAPKFTSSYLGNALRILERVVPMPRTRVRALNFLRAKLEGKDPSDPPQRGPAPDVRRRGRKPGRGDLDT